MAHLIDKSALVAELKKRFDYRVNGLKAINNGTFWNEDQSEDTFNEALTRCAYNEAKNEVFELMCFLDTLEVIEIGVDVGSPEGNLSIKTVQVIDADGNIKEITFNKAQKGE